MKTLEEIGVKHGTGKSSLTCNYLRFYELLFGPWRFKPINILEIGVQFGYSLRTWREYFPSARIIGVDMVDNGTVFPAKDGIVFIQGNAYSPEMIKRIEGRFDIILDDGSHNVLDQQFVAQFYSPLLSDEGVLIIEDVLSPDSVELISQMLPEKFDWVSINMSNPKCRLFLAWRKDLRKL